MPYMSIWEMVRVWLTRSSRPLSGVIIFWLAMGSSKCLIKQACPIVEEKFFSFMNLRKGTFVTYLKQFGLLC